MPQRLKLKEHQQLPYLTVLRKMWFILPILPPPTGWGNRGSPLPVRSERRRISSGHLGNPRRPAQAAERRAAGVGRSALRRQAAHRQGDLQNAGDLQADLVQVYRRGTLADVLNRDP